MGKKYVFPHNGILFTIKIIKMLTHVVTWTNLVNIQLSEKKLIPNDMWYDSVDVKYPK